MPQNELKRFTHIAILSICFLCASSLVAFQRATNQGKDKESDTCETYLKQKPPKYRLARQFHTQTNYGSALHIFVSIDQKDVTRDKLLALSCKLGIDHANEENFFVFILDTHRAAKRFNPQGEGNDRQTNLADRAFYAFSRERGDAYGQSLTWKPDRYDPDRWVNIELGRPPERPAQEKRN